MTAKRTRRIAGWCLPAAAAVTMIAVAIGLSPGASGQANAGRYQLQVDTARDPGTRLIWQRALSGGAVSQAAAVQYCADLILAGADDWRLPSLQELHTIVDEARADPSIDPLAFPDTPAGGFWSATAWAGTSALAWHVDFDIGGSAYDSATMLYRVRCVRADP
ncbi:MAG: DUF1566 domain-containing protein [Bacteroidota bacterium]